jgi:hypothetical protein
MRMVCSIKSVLLRVTGTAGTFWPNNSRVNLPSVSFVGP